MSAINGGFVAKLAEIWHRFTLPEAERQTLADMLAPMDDAGESVARHLEFDMEPSEFNRVLQDLAPERQRP